MESVVLFSRLLRWVVCSLLRQVTLPLFILKASREELQLLYTIQIPCPCLGTKQLTKCFQRCYLTGAWQLRQGGRSGWLSQLELHTRLMSVFSYLSRLKKSLFPTNPQRICAFGTTHPETWAFFASLPFQQLDDVQRQTFISLVKSFLILPHLWQALYNKTSFRNFT